MIEYLFLSKEYRFAHIQRIDTFLSKKDTPVKICQSIFVPETILNQYNYGYCKTINT